MIRTLVIGGGAAGAALAARLAESHDRRVVLVEAGRAVEEGSELRDGSVLAGATPGHPANWAYKTELFRGRPGTIPRGRALGGSTATNGGYFVRARPGDFAHWAAVGGPEWAYEHVLPLLAGLENDLDLPDAPGHGSDGPVRVRRPAQTGALITSFHEAAQALGFAAEPDKNAYCATPGIGPVPSNFVDGVRVNTAMSYLPAAGQPGSCLEILTATRVLRVAIDHGRATGVEVVREGSSSSERLSADEVVLCAGAIATPQLLLLSGVGPAGHLEALGIPVVSDLPVGKDFSDHPNLTVDWHARTPLADPAQRFAFPSALNFDSSGQAAEHPEGDLEILLSVKSSGALLAGGASAPSQPGADAMQLFVALQAPLSRGRLALRDADPLVPPRIEHRYLEHAEDIDRLRIGVRTAATMLQSSAFDALFDDFVSLDRRTLDDDERLEAWIRSHLGTAIHTCGTAAMGCVVDGQGRVRGVEGLRVADTSILPRVPSRGPANTAVLIGELIARHMLSS